MALPLLTQPPCTCMVHHPTRPPHPHPTFHPAWLLTLRQSLTPPSRPALARQVLRQLPALRNLSLRGCPLAEQPGYREAILALAPGLEILDNQRVKERPAKGAKRQAEDGGGEAAEGAPAEAGEGRWVLREGHRGLRGLGACCGGFEERR